MKLSTRHVRHRRKTTASSRIASAVAKNDSSPEKRKVAQASEQPLDAGIRNMYAFGNVDTCNRVQMGLPLGIARASALACQNVGMGSGAPEPARGTQ